MTSFRPNFDAEMADIIARVIRMGSDALDMVTMAVDAALTSDHALAQKVIDADDGIDLAERETLTRTVMVVLRETPVAADLRRLVSTLGIIGEIEKVADDAVKLAKRSIKVTGHFPGEMKLALSEMATLSKHAFSTALRLYSEYDPALARSVLEEEASVDEKYVENRGRIFDLIQEDPSETAQLVRVIELFHALEHISDHAVEIVSRLRVHWESQEG